MTTSYDEALDLYYKLRPAAIEAYDEYILTRTPARLQADMDTILAPNAPKLMISDTQAVPIKNESGVDVPGSPGTARATSDFTGYIELIIPPLGGG